jgi:hypothetical protein
MDRASTSVKSHWDVSYSALMPNDLVFVDDVPHRAIGSMELRPLSKLERQRLRSSQILEKRLSTALRDAIPLCFHGTGPIVYFLFRGESLVYVGKTMNVHRRIGQHLEGGFKIFDAVRILPFKENELSEAERRLIQLLKPEYNGYESR